MKLTQEQQWELVNRFIEAKRKVKGETYFLKQSQPEIGVWTSEGFFSIKFLVETFNNKYKTTYEV